ncbi:MAG TPA: HAD family hydrolase [Kofleriaceae bacterium]|nr:HAD family hydrolase [Kofleriaceae bacterium]
MDRAESSDRPRLGAVVFDFDGVILESADIKTDAFVELFSHLPPSLVAQVREHHLANLGISRFVKFDWIYQNVIQQPLAETERLELGDRFSSIALRKVLACPFVPGAEAALAALAPRYPLFVASGTPQDELDRVVDARELRAHFREVWGSPREKANILADIASRHDLAMDQILFVGDGASDERAARAAGTHFLARTTPPLADHWARSGARQVEDLVSLVSLVDAW